MQVKDFVLKKYPIVHPYTGVNEIEKELLNKKYFVVQDESGRFYGILTPSDIISRPHKLVIDCMTEKEQVNCEEDIRPVYLKMIANNIDVLPVFSNNSFIGVIHIFKIMEILKRQKESLAEKLMETEYQLNREMGKAQVAEKMKTAFLHNISHEIRTPMNGLVGFSNLLISKDVAVEEKQIFVNYIESSSKRLLHVINEIVEISRIQAGDFSVNINGTYSLSKLLDELRIYYEAEKRKMGKETIKVNCKNEIGEFAAITTDVPKLRYILSLLINNALKFTEKGYIEIGCKLGIENETVLYVKDTGIGIPSERQNEIFNAFEKFAKNDEFSLPGIGLGLTIARHLLHSIGGEIEVVSEENLGSTFLVTLFADKKNKISNN